MARPRVFDCRLNDKERKYLEALIRKPTEQARRILRAKVMLDADKGLSNKEISAMHRISCPAIIRVLKKKCLFGVEGALEDLKRSGRRNVIEAPAKAWIISLACTKPSELPDGPAAQIWSVGSLRQYIAAHCMENDFPELEKISGSTVWKILNDNEISPHQMRYYLEKKDEQFNEKARGVLLLYKRVAWILQIVGKGKNPSEDSGEGEVVISYDEKPGIQALGNIAPDLPPKPGRGVRLRDYEYKRYGTVSLLAGIDLMTGEVIGLVRDSHKSADFIDFLKMADAKYKKGLKIHIILDNHSVHRSKEAMEYLSTVPERFDFTFTPKHASWLNLVESLFSKLARQALRGLRVNSKEELVNHIMRWIADVNASPVSYRWTWNLDDIWGAFTKRRTRVID